MTAICTGLTLRIGKQGGHQSKRGPRAPSDMHLRIKPTIFKNYKLLQLNIKVTNNINIFA